MSCPILFRIAGPSNSGKTTWMLELVRRLREHGLKVSTIKHSHHTLDVPNKDGHRLGALAPNITVGQDRILFDQPLEDSPNMFELIERFYSDMDVVLVEGWRQENVPTLLIADPPTDWFVPDDIVARTMNVVSETFEHFPIWGVDHVVHHISVQCSRKRHRTH